MNLVNFQEDIQSILLNFQKGTKNHVDLLYQELDKQIETLKVDSKEKNDSLGALQTSVRSIQHLANSLRTAKVESKQVSADQEYRYFHFEENFRGSREEIKDKFRGYVRHFQRGVQGPVLDLGCGRGEFLELLKENSIQAIGVDSNLKMVEQCKQLKLDVSQGDLLEFLRAEPRIHLAEFSVRKLSNTCLPTI